MREGVGAVVSATIRSNDVAVGSDHRDRRVAWVVVAVALLTVGAVYAGLRWPGFLPVGSDNDEYQLVGAALARFEPPVVAGVEGTKYPLGYPFLLAVFEWVGLPPARSALVLNLGALAVATGTIAALAGRATATRPARPAAALAAGGVIVTSAAVWNDVYSVMPEILLLTVVALLLATLATDLDRRRLALLTGLAVAAVLLKTLAALLVVGGCGLVWLLAQRDRPAGVALGRANTRILVPAVAAVGVVLAGMVLMRPYPEHTTGYLATFPLADPDDASQGRLTPAGLVVRALRDVPDTLADLGRAVVLIDAGTWLAVLVALGALALGVVAAWRLWPGRALGAFAAGAAVAYAVGMAGWPYHSSRFGLPLVPIAALGAGWLVRELAPPGPRSWLVGSLVLAALVATSAGPVIERGETAREQLASQHAALDRLEDWGAGTDDDVRLVSFDYREAARLLDRRVEPIAYTTDTQALLDQVEQADRLVVLDLYGKRTVQANALLREHGEHFELLVEDEGLRIYAVRE